MLFDIFNVFPYYLHVNYWTGKSVRIFSRKQEISGNFRRYDVYSWVCDGLRELSHGLFVWALDKQSFDDGSNYFVVLTEFNCIYLGNVVHVIFYI